MTFISLRLVGYNSFYNIEIEKPSITIIDIFNFLIHYGMSVNELSFITFIHKGSNITELTDNYYTGTKEDPLLIHMLSNKSDVKMELIRNIFKYSQNNNNDDDKLEKLELEKLESEKLKKIESEKQKMQKDNEKDMKKHNLKTIELFSDPDFMYLLKICLNKPDLLNTVSSYIMSGDISYEIKKLSNLAEFKYEDEFKELMDIITKLNINIKDENFINIKSTITHFEGNINLSLRYLMQFKEL